ncbi:unnamed protein product [Malus baccata var. baccata]
MRSLKVLFQLAMLMALVAITLSATPDQEFEESFFGEEDNSINVSNSETFKQEKTSLRGISRFLASRGRAVTCDSNPKVCRGGTHCCHKKCVDLKTDNLHCGQCGVKSHHSQICCHGHLVNPISDKKHCGSCDNHCKKGRSCALGMCSYA